MHKEKFHIPLPDDRTVEFQIKQIVAAGVKPKKSFLSYLSSMYQQIGTRHLFSDRSELVFILITAITLLSIFGFRPESTQAQVHQLYAYIFLISPVLFLFFSIYTYSNKIMNTTYEVEMACKYNVYQIISFRMFTFSIVAILFNTITISLFAFMYEDMQFLRAFMISITGLFTFSILFLYAMMKQRSTAIVALTISGWALGNLLLKFMYNQLYSELLVNLPLYIYGIVFIGTSYMYLIYLNKLIHFKQTEESY